MNEYKTIEGSTHFDTLLNNCVADGWEPLPESLHSYLKLGCHGSVEAVKSILLKRIKK